MCFIFLFVFSSSELNGQDSKKNEHGFADKQTNSDIQNNKTATPTKGNAGKRKKRATVCYQDESRKRSKAKKVLNRLLGDVSGSKNADKPSLDRQPADEDGALATSTITYDLNSSSTSLIEEDNLEISFATM